MRPEPTRIEPIFSPRIWGARSLAPLFPEKSNLTEPLGEAWLTGVDCKIVTGPFAGKTLGDAWREMPADWRGTGLASTTDFPILVKFIFPNDKLSIQVHPDDAYAAAHEKAAGGRGKTEMWHAVSAEPGAHVLAGLKPGVDKEKFLAALESQTLENLFEALPVHEGDTFFLPAGTPHTIGPGMVLCEVQEYSDLTYRVYDYGRVDAYGKPRELHVEKAMTAMNFKTEKHIKTNPLTTKHNDMGLAMMDRGLSILAACKYFATARWEISKTLRLISDPEAFRLLIVLSGAGQVVWGEGNSIYRAGECWFVPAELGEYSVLPRDPTVLLETFVPDMPSFLKELKLAGFPEAEVSEIAFC